MKVKLDQCVLDLVFNLAESEVEDIFIRKGVNEEERTKMAEII